jgi:hypothetical protein
MTPENWKVVEAISTAVTAVSVFFISGFAAIWTWYRDTERLKAYRSINNWPVQVPDLAKDVRQVQGMKGFANISVTIVNHSLNSSGIAGVGFDFGSQIFWFREPEIRDDETTFEARKRQLAEEQFGGAGGPVPLGRKRTGWPLQVPAKGRVTVWAGQFDLSIMSEGGVTVADIVDGKTVAVVRTESGKLFRTRVTTFGKMRGELKRSLDEMKADKPERFTFDVWNDHRGWF